MFRNHCWMIAVCIIGLLPGRSPAQSALTVVAAKMGASAASTTFTLSGKVIDGEGKPMPGASVGVTTNYLQRSMIDRYTAGQHPDLSTTSTDNAGAFSFPLQKNRTYSIIVTSAGYVPVLERFEPYDARTIFKRSSDNSAASGTIILHRQSAFSGIVADENGKPLPGVTVSAFPATVTGPSYDSSPLQTGMSDGDGKFKLTGLPEQAVALQFSAPGFATSHLTVQPGEPAAVNMERGVTVRGQAVDMDGNPAGGVGVLMRMVPAGWAAEDQGKPKPFPMQWGATAISGESGAFEYRNVPPGQYAFSLSTMPDGKIDKAIWSGDGSVTHVTISESGAPPPVLLKIYSGYTLRGQVMESGTTKTIAGARVWLMDTMGGHGSTFPSTISDEAGQFTFDHVFPQSGVRLTAEAPGFRMQQQNNYRGGTGTTVTLPVTLPSDKPVADISIPMEASRVLRGMVIDSDTSEPITGAKVEVVEKRFNEAGQRGNPNALSGPNGRFALECYASEGTRLRAAADGYAPVISDPLSLVDASELTLRLSRGQKLTGIVLDPDDKPAAEAQVHGYINLGIAQSASGNDNSYREVLQGISTADDGTFTLDRLPPGCRVNLGASKDGFANSEGTSYFIRKDADVTSVVLKLRVAKRLSGRVLDPDGKPLGEANINAVSKASNGSGFYRTKADGNYALNSLPDAPVDIFIQHPQYGQEYFYNEAVGRDNVDFQFGKGDKDGKMRYEMQRQEQKDRSEKTGVALHGKVVDYKTNLPIQKFEVSAPYGARVKMDPDVEGAFTVTGLLVASPYQTLRIISPGYAPYDSDVIYIHTGQTKIDKTFKLGPGGSIVGRAVNKETHEPVAGVIVSLGQDLYSPMPLPAQLKPAPVVSGADGKFALPGVGKGRKVVVFEPPPETGFVKMTQEVEVVYNESTDMRDVEFGSGGGIKGKLVRMPGSIPIPNARVEARGQKSATTDAEGAFEFTGLQNGLYFVEAPEYGANSWIGIDNLETKELTLEVGSGKLIGTVTRAGKPVSCDVKLQKSGPGQSVARFVASDSAGSFVVEGLAPGRWGVQFTGKGGGQAFTAGDSVIMPNTGEDVEKTFTLPSGGLRVTVLDGGGQPVKGASVTVRQQTSADSALQANANTGVSDSNGQITFEGLDAGTYAATATTDDNRRASKNKIAVADGQQAAASLTLDFGAGGTLVSIALNMSNGKPLPTAWCYLFDEDGQLFEHGQQRDEMGVMTINNIPPGRYRAKVSAFSFSASEKPVEIRSGETAKIEDVLYPAGALRWAVRDATGAAVVGASCTLTPVDSSAVEDPRSGITDEQGMFVVRGLMPGSYTATAKTKDGRSVTTGINISASNATDAISMVK